MRLIDLIERDRVRVPLRSGSKEELLRELVDALVPPGSGAADDVLRAVFERESVLSTGIGGGVAIPHAKTDAVDELCIAAGCVEPPVDFEALDGQPVQLVFLLIGPESQGGAHVKALSRIARVLRRAEVRDRLCETRQPEDFLRVLDEAERS